MQDDPVLIMERVRQQLEKLSAHVERIAVLWQAQSQAGPPINAEGKSLSDLLVMCLGQHQRPMRVTEIAAWVLRQTTYRTSSVHFTIVVSAKLVDLASRGQVVKVSRGIWALPS